MSDEYLDVFTADHAITALSARVQPDVDDPVIDALGAWVGSIDAAVPDRVPDFASVPRIDPGRRGLRITALVVAGVLALMSTGVAFAVGDHPFAPIERVVRHVVRPAKVQPLGAPPADESSAVGAQPSGSGSAPGLFGRAGGTAPGASVLGGGRPGRAGQSADGPLTPPTAAISTTILDITTTFLPLPTLGPSITMTIMTLQSPTTSGTPTTTDPSTSPSPGPSTGPTPTFPPSTAPTPTVPPSTGPTPTSPSTTEPPSTGPTPTSPSTTGPASTDPTPTSPSTTTPSSSTPSTTTPSSSTPSTTTPSSSTPSTTPSSTGVSPSASSPSG